MEEEEQALIDKSFKHGFQLWREGHQILDVEQIKLLDKEFKKVQESLDKNDAETLKSYTEAKESVIKCLKLIKRCASKDELESSVFSQLVQLCPNVDFEQ